MTADTVGGVWSHALELAAALGERGVHVSLATMGALPTPVQRAQAALLPGLELHESGWRLEWMEDPWDDVRRAGQWLLELERTLHPDVVHLNQFAFGDLPFAAPKLVVARGASPVCAGELGRLPASGEARAGRRHPCRCADRGHALVACTRLWVHQGRPRAAQRPRRRKVFSR
jgi:hypothetical protein